MAKYDSRWVSVKSGADVKWWLRMKAKIDTGAARCSIDDSLARALRLPLIGTVKVKNAMGKQIRPLYETIFRIGSKKYTVQLSGADRGMLATPLLIGKDLIEILDAVESS